MAEEMTISSGTKEEKYLELLPQLQSVLSDETDLIANMANMAAMLHETFGFWWTGFYRVASQSPMEETVQMNPRGTSPSGGEELVLGPFQGPLACTRIRKGKGVCGTAWAEEKTQVVPDVDLFPGHIACSSASRSEIVVPVWKDGTVIAVLDIDSAELNTFDEVDRKYLEQAVKFLV